MGLENLTTLEAWLLFAVAGSLIFIGVVQLISVYSLSKLCDLAREDVLWTMDEIQEEHSKVSAELRELRSLIMDHSESMSAFQYYEEQVEEEEEDDGWPT